jgi:2-iminobutanoate/2-iminopropanoate deaminase
MPRFLSIAEQTSVSPRPIHGVLTGAAFKRLVVSALPGMRPDGSLPEGLAAQAEQAFENLATLIEAAGLTKDDIVKIAAYVAAPGAKALVHRTASLKLGGLRPATAVRQVVSLSQAGCLVELDAEAVRED